MKYAKIERQYPLTYNTITQITMVTCSKCGKQGHTKKNTKFHPKDIEMLEPKKDERIHTKGTGAGGSNTNKHGLPYETMTDLSDTLNIIE